jgi:hypothetical protein
MSGFYQSPAQKANLEAKLMRRLASALESGKYVAKSNCPIDTSSLYESIRVEEPTVDGTTIKGALLAGGVDYRDRTFLSTGKQGNLVDYANEQNIKTGFLDSAAPTIFNEATQ